MAVREIDMGKLCTEYFHGLDQADSTSMDVSDESINMNNLRLTVKDIKWEKMSQPSFSSPLARTVNIGKTAGGDADYHAFGQVRTSKQCEHGVTVTLESGIIKGINKLINLPLKGTDLELINEFGSYLEVDPNKTVSEILQKTIKFDVSLEQDIGPKGASAIVQSQQKKCTWRFTCTVVIDGKIIHKHLSVREEGRISEIIRSLKEENSSDDSLDALSVVGRELNKVAVTMKGEIEFRWEKEHNIEWKDACA